MEAPDNIPVSEANPPTDRRMGWKPWENGQERWWMGTQWSDSYRQIEELPVDSPEAENLIQEYVTSDKTKWVDIDPRKIEEGQKVRIVIDEVNLVGTIFGISKDNNGFGVPEYVMLGKNGNVGVRLSKSKVQVCVNE